MSLVGYSPWGCKRVGHDSATKQQQDKNHPINVQENSGQTFFGQIFYFFEQKEVENIKISLPRLLERKNEGNI